MTQTLEARLLAVCNVAANVRESGYFREDSEAFAGAGFVGSMPKAIVGGTDGINAALVGDIGDATVVCYRGTLAPDDETRTLDQRLLDWAHDAEAVLCPWIDGMLCHQGFCNAVDSINLRMPDMPGQIVFTGHSKGGALAQLAALRFWLTYRKPVRCVTFGAPRAGASSFATAIADSGVSLTRFENAGDLVPHLPLDPRLARSIGLPVETFDFRSAGTIAFVTATGEVERPEGLFEELQVEASAMLHVAKSIASGFETVRAAHSIAEGGGYWNGVHGIAQKEAA